MTLSSLGITNAEILGNLGLVLGVNRDSSEWPTQVQDDSDRIIRAARRKLVMAHDWSFLEHDYPILTTPSSEITGSCANGVITTASSIPASMAGAYKVAPAVDGGLYDVASQGVGTITLVNTAAANDFVSQTIVLYKFRYALPTNWAAFIDPIVVENWQTGTQLAEYATLPEFQIRGTLAKINTLTGPPEIFAVTHDVTAETGSFSPYLLTYPLMVDAYVLKTRIRITPGDSLAEVGEVFHATQSELLMEAILSQAEIMYGKPDRTHTELFAAMLPLAIQQDKRMRGTRSVLPRETQMTDAQLSRIAAQRAEIDLSGALIS